jgi:hypothetical protein
MTDEVTLDELKFMCSEYIKKGGSAVIYMDSKTVSLNGEISSFDDAADKLKKDLNLYSHERF